MIRDPRLTTEDQAMLRGELGEARAMAMRILVCMARATGAERMTDISGAHIDGTLYLGEASLDFAGRLRDLGGRVVVPTTLNVSSLDLLHPELFQGDDRPRKGARATASAYLDMGASPTWTCAPYQLASRPGFGERVAWGESNAIVFANSVLGARTPRFGDFADIAAAITGRAPEFGLYLDEHRRAGVHFDVSPTVQAPPLTEEFFAVLGILIGRESGSEVPVITGIESADEDHLKVLGAAAATSGAVGLFHMVGVTPEAPSLASVAPDQTNLRRVTITGKVMKQAYRSLSSIETTTLHTVNLGTPHYSTHQITRLKNLLGGRRIHPEVKLYVNTGRDTLVALSEVIETLEEVGVTFVTDTCTYVTSIIPSGGVAMTDSAKWAYYAPGNLGVAVVFGSTADCVESAVAGRIIKAEPDW